MWNQGLILNKKLSVLVISSLLITGCQSSRNYSSNTFNGNQSYASIDSSNDISGSLSEIKSTPHEDEHLQVDKEHSEIVLPVTFETKLKDELTLENITQIALQNNPVIKQAEAAASKASGYRNQVGLYPNPTVGYSGNQIADKNTDQHTLFVTQDIVTSQKLERNVNVLSHEVENQKWQAEQQRRTVLADVKKLYYDVLGAQKQYELSTQLVDIAEKSVKITEDHKKIGESSNVDILQSKVQLQQLVITQKQAKARLESSWKQLTATMGIPHMPIQAVAGELPAQTVQFNWDDEYSRIISQSPEVMAARSRISRSLALLDRQRVQANPNVSVSLQAGYDRATDSQLINTQIGMPLPVYNKNQGNISAAYSEYYRSTHDLRRIELSIKTRLAEVAREYESASAAVALHRDEVLPKTKEMLDMADQTFKIGEISFLQVLTIRKTYFDANLTYVSARTDLAKAQVTIDELLLSGSLNNVPDSSLDDGLRGESISGQ